MRRIELVVVWRRLYLIFAFGNYGILWQVQCGQHLFTPSFSKRTYYKPRPHFQSNKPFAGQKMVLGWYKDGPQRSTNGPQVVVKWVFAELLCLSNSNLTSSWDVVWFCRMRRHNQGGTNASLHNCIRHHLKRMPTPGTILVIRPASEVSNFHQKIVVSIFALPTLTLTWADLTRCVTVLMSFSCAIHRCVTYSAAAATF